MAGQLVIFVGLQAAGKSSFFRERFASTHAHVSKDLMPRAARDKESRQLAQVEQALLIGQPVVVDNTNPRAADRAPLIELARRYEARVVGYFFEPGIQDSLRRNAAREPQVPKVAIFTTAKKLQPPSFEEGFDEIHHVRLAGGGGFSVAQRAR
ncbi:MAG: ATP-binding protein [Deltaproteobacteria bacterium]|nr:MAG: ATP-binding protein [Deltaproteobacteria bacterium]